MICKKVISECRCPDDKYETLTVCQECKDEQKRKEREVFGNIIQ